MIVIFFSIFFLKCRNRFFCTAAPIYMSIFVLCISIPTTWHVTQHTYATIYPVIHTVVHGSLDLFWYKQREWLLLYAKWLYPYCGRTHTHTLLTNGSFNWREKIFVSTSTFSIDRPNIIIVIFESSKYHWKWIFTIYQIKSAAITIKSPENFTLQFKRDMKKDHANR